MNAKNIAADTLSMYLRVHWWVLCPQTSEMRNMF